jgi:hypothetical protein
MGDWNQKRIGLTKRERGIPKEILDTKIKELNFTIVKRSYSFTATAFLRKRLDNKLNKPLLLYKNYLLFDQFISKFLGNFTKYHTTNNLRRFFPQSLYYILKK